MSTLKEKAKELPTKPGVYLFKDAEGKVLYVGKAKNLHSRVLQYFGHDNRPQLPYLMQEAADFDVTIVHSELEALFLENTLIKQYVPPYNIKLRDDKNYAFIQIDYNTQIPHISYARKITNLGNSHFFGPYSSAKKIKQTLDIVRKIFPYCANTEIGTRPCFYYYLHRCPGICIGAISIDEYYLQLKQIEEFLHGDTVAITSTIAKAMKLAARKKQFEQAVRYRDQLKALDILRERQTMMFTKSVNWDFIATYSGYGDTCINVFKVREGRLMDKENFIYQESANHKIKEAQPVTMASSAVTQTFLENYYSETSDIPREVYIEQTVSNTALIAKLLYARAKHKIPILVPTRGQKLQLIKLGKTNAEEYLKKWQASSATNISAVQETLTELQLLLKLPQLPRRIEGYDISNTQGTNSVGSMVVAQEGLPIKSEYRKFKIQIKQTPDDFAMMHETIYRRLNHLPEIASAEVQAWDRPDLIVIDGGKGQLSAALKAQDLFLKANSYKLKAIPMIGLAKRIEEIFLPNNPVPIILDHSSPVLQLLQRLRDEAHRFGITFHRQLRSKQATKSVLDSIPGIGPKTKKLLKQKFGTVGEIRKITLEELEKLVGKSKASIIKQNL